MKNILIFGFAIIMIFFKSTSHAEYEKIFFDFKIKSIRGDTIDLNDFKGKPVLLVNTASYCGFTKQYGDLQNLWENYQEKGLVVIGIPSNSFNQEPGSNEEVKNFCEAKFGISFPMTQKVEVRGDKAHPFYKWANNNFGRGAIPKWNFHKIIVGKDGKVFDTFASMTRPNSKKFINAIEKALKK